MIGQSSHRGPRATQTSAPSSITATFHVLAASRSAGRHSSARRDSALVRVGDGSARPSTARARTLPHVGVDDDLGLLEGEAGDGGRGVGTDSG